MTVGDKGILERLQNLKFEADKDDANQDYRLVALSTLEWVQFCAALEHNYGIDIEPQQWRAKYLGMWVYADVHATFGCEGGTI